MYGSTVIYGSPDINGFVLHNFTLFQDRVRHNMSIEERDQTNESALKPTMNEGSGCFEQQFSEISIHKSPSRKKKAYPAHLYPDESNKENGFDGLRSHDKRIRDNSYGISDTSSTKPDVQFSFMKETSSSLQKKSNVRKRDSSRQLSNPIKPRRIASKHKVDAVESRRALVKDISLSPDSPRRVVSSITTPKKPSASIQSPRSYRNFSQPLPSSQSDDVFTRLYTSPRKSDLKRPSRSTDSPSKPSSRPLMASKRSVSTSPPKFQTLSELYQALWAKDPSLFNFNSQDGTIRPALRPDEIPNMAHLNVYERGEIIRRNELYFVPNSCRDVNMSDKNFGFDDKEDNYNVIAHDHINYRYETLNVLGNGSFGTVVMSRDHKFSKLCAIKIIKNDINWTLQSVREIKMLKLLNEKETNENILTYYEHFNFRSHMCIVTELLSINLYSLLEITNFKGLSLPIIQNMTRQILNGIQYMHKYDIIHCDIKPENIMVKLPTDYTLDKITVKIIDFGTSCFSNEILFTYIQSRFYRAPEVIVGASYDKKIDIWSMGCVIAELYTGAPLLPGKTELEQVGLILELFGAPKSSTIIKYRSQLVKSLQKQKTQDLESTNNIPVNDKQMKKTLLYKIFDLSGKINISLLNNYVNASAQQTSSIKKQYKLNTRSLEIALRLNGNDDLSKAFLQFLSTIFIWDSFERSSVDELLQHEFLSE